MKKMQKIITSLVVLCCVQLHANYSDVAMADPDIVEAVSNVSEVGVIDTTAEHMGDRSVQKKSKKRSKKKAKNQANPANLVPAKSEKTAVKNADVQTLPTDVYLVDSIDAIVFAPEGTKIITHSELERPSLDGRPRTLEDLVYECLMMLDAQKFKMTPDEEIIDKHLAAVQRDNNLTLEDLKNVFKSAGYTYEEGREQFGVISIINQMLDFKIRSRLIVLEREVVTYYNAHPETQDASYRIQVGIIPFAYSQSYEEQRESIMQALHENKGRVEIEWQEPFWIEKNEIAQDKEFLISMRPGTISDPVQTEQGFQVFKKVEEKREHLLTLEERYRSISDILRRPKYEQLFNEYREQLMNGASVKYLN